MGKSKNSSSKEDLIFLVGDNATDSKVTLVLQEKFSKEEVYSRIGQNIIVSVNPGKPLEITTDSNAKSIGNAVKDGKDRPAHVFELAATTYYAMVKDRQDQSLVFLGDSGSGKSEAFNLATREIVVVSKNKKKEKTSARLLKAIQILEAFGNAKTTQNDNSSRFGKAVEIQFGSRGKLSGARLKDYLLEKKRVTKVLAGERGFHVFYYLLSGASHTEKTKWGLDNLKNFRLLEQSKALKSNGIDDISKYSELKAALKTVGFKEKYQSQIFQVLAVILHLGNIQFVESESRDEAAVISNAEELEICSDLLGVRSRDLENALVVKTKLIKKELCTMLLDAEEASEQRDSLCQTLYSLLWSWMVDTINRHLCDEDSQSKLTLVDMFGIENLKENSLWQFLGNFSAEKLLNFFNETIYDHEIAEYQTEKVSFPEVSYNDNTEILDLIAGRPSGILTVFEDEGQKAKKKVKVSSLIETLNEAHSKNDFYITVPKKSKVYMFGVKHFGSDVYYDAKDFIESNIDIISPDFITVFRGGPDLRPSKNSFIENLFSQKSVESGKGADGLDSKENSEKGNEKFSRSGALINDFRAGLDQLISSLGTPRFCLCVRPSLTPNVNHFDKKVVEAQVHSFGLPDVIKMKALGFGARFSYTSFIDRYRLAVDSSVIDKIDDPKQKVLLMLHGLDTASDEYVLGLEKVFLTEEATRGVDMKLKAAEKEERKRIKEKLNRGEPIDDTGDSRISSYIADEQSDIDSDVDGATAVSESEMTDNETLHDDNMSQASFGTEFSGIDDVAGKGAVKKNNDYVFEEEEQPISGVRKWWLRATTFLTWWIPTRCLEWNGMKRADIQQAWREKLALCMLIIFVSGLMLFFITGFSVLLCPDKNMFTLGELSGYNSPNGKEYVGAWGMVFDYTTARLTHANIDSGAAWIDQFAGLDSTAAVFPRKPDLCGLPVPGNIDYNAGVQYAHNPATIIPILNKKSKLWKGYIAYSKAEVAKYGWNIFINDRVYNMTFYQQNSLSYFPAEFNALLGPRKGQDATADFKKLPAVQQKTILNCLDLIHFVGVIDTRDSPQCVFANAILLSATGVLVAIMVIKFLSALQLGSKGTPEDYDRFVIIQVPCYTEGEENLRRTLDSLTTLRYDDKRKLLFIIVDGNIIGSGNDRPTWRIVLDILGVDPAIDPPKLSFYSLGEGNRQHNMGKVYSGLYDCAGHLVPFIVVSKVGKDTETRRPGNRGKRDSQLILMRFLQKVHYDDPMSPLELELYHQIKNVIGVDPSFYEFILMVDADTEVTPDSLNRLVSYMVHDAKVVGLCGETTISNERDSAITMMQVYEYYISHHLAKAFESLFGSVTCLPGCFCMYRIRTPNKSIPLLTSKQVISDYAVNDVDTLHKKNLLSLGEDRYLTTLMLKHFPNMKIKFTPDAVCKTMVPDRWPILLSQRRRWINSTIHNLLELMLLPQLCGFCCFSMRFVVFFDLFATLVMPATMGYLVFLIYSAATSQGFPLISLVLLAAGYGLQIVIFVLKAKWEHIGWLFIYLLALPFFTFLIPLYAFWHFDDFSWGNTRVVVGEKGGRKQILDEEPFDENSIPMKKWSDYEAEIWERESQLSGSAISATQTVMSEQKSAVASQYGAGSQYVAPSYVPSEVNGNGFVPSGSRPMSMMPGSMPVVIAQGSPIMHSTIPGPDGFPSDDQIFNQIKSILATADLMSVTKKQVRDELSLFFGVDMSPKKDFINKVIEDVLQGKA